MLLSLQHLLLGERVDPLELLLEKLDLTTIIPALLLQLGNTRGLLLHLLVKLIDQLG